MQLSLLTKSSLTNVGSYIFPLTPYVMMINGQEDVCAVKRVSQLAYIYVRGTGGRSKEKYPSVSIKVLLEIKALLERIPVMMAMVIVVLMMAMTLTAK